MDLSIDCVWTCTVLSDVVRKVFSSPGAATVANTFCVALDDSEQGTVCVGLIVLLHQAQNRYSSVLRFSRFRIREALVSSYPGVIICFPLPRSQPTAKLAAAVETQRERFLHRVQS